VYRRNGRVSEVLRPKNFLRVNLGARTGCLLERRSEDRIWGHVRGDAFPDLGSRTGGLLRRRLEDKIWGHAREEHLGGGS
jgi:hypothetical protein